MLRWRPWPPLPSKRFHVKLKLHAIEGLQHLISENIDESGRTATSNSCGKTTEMNKIIVKVKWKGPRAALASRLKRGLHHMKTQVKIPEHNCIVKLDEDTEYTCILTVAKDARFLPWDVSFTIYEVAVKPKSVMLGTANMDLAEFVLLPDASQQEAKIHVLMVNGVDCEARIVVSTSFVELRTSEIVDPHLTHVNGPLPNVVDEEQSRNGLSEESLKAFNVSNSATHKKSDADFSSKTVETSDDSSRNSVDCDSSDKWDDEGLIEAEQYCLHSYGALSGVNLVVEGALSHFHQTKHSEGQSRLTCNRELTEFLTKEGVKMVLPACGTQSSGEEQNALQFSVLSLLAWKKRKLNLRSHRMREEPLLKKAYGENGGDDIDFERRLSDSPVNVSAMMTANAHEKLVPAASGCCVDFGEEDFAVGSWEKHQFISRDNRTKLSANVFFATIDQRNERAAGESACTVLVAFIADWLQNNPGRMPIKAELDTLIRQGSGEWRRLCEDEAYRERFPDKHFDLDTVLNAKLRPLIVLPENSFIGFFQPLGMHDCCDFFQGVMSFESVWEEIIGILSDGCFESAIYIVSWNDHFFILKLERDTCYIIDTLGERLFEGCQQAYIIRFDNETMLSYVSQSEDEQEGPSDKSAARTDSSTKPVEAPEHHEDDVNQRCPDNRTIYRGKDACKEFIKGFFAGLPLRELEMDMNKELLEKMSLHHRLQIEFHFTSSSGK